MKIKISKNRLGNWIVEFNKHETAFANYDAATEFALKIWKRYYKEQAAFARLESINPLKLSIRELDFYDDLSRTKCKGITKAQYGFLAGIYERQERKW